MSLASWTGLTGSALLIATAVTLAPRKSTAVRWLIPVVGFVVAYVPIHGVPIAGYLRGIIGDISVTTWILLVAAVISNLADREIVHAPSRTVLVLLVLFSGFALYPSALGLTYLDTYALGYGSEFLLAVFLSLSLLAWYLGYHIVTTCLAASVLAYSLRIFESGNLWDYWIDPLVTIYALQRSFRMVRRLALGKMPAQPASRD